MKIGNKTTLVEFNFIFTSIVSSYATFRQRQCNFLILSLFESPVDATFIKIIVSLDALIENLVGYLRKEAWLKT